MIQQKTAIKNCLTCNKPIKGRSDKKFCDDYCRNNYNNQLKAAAGTQVRLINNALAKNHRILQSLLPADKEMMKTTREQLLLKGFQFKYITHIYTTQAGKTYYYCYDHGYLPLDNDWFLIVKRKEE
jgi:predicted nucleic acid-binding Zn ribbon protein